MIERFQSYAPLFDAFAASGFSLYLVGGCVRDVVMGLDASGDVDLATDALPEETKETLIGSGFKSFPIGEKFGTITTLVGDVAVEITTLRVGEVYEPRSRHPRVEFGSSIEADLSRRDLSLNAMAMGRDGAIVDPFDGHRAIREGILEVPGGGYENTLSILRDDPLRLLRVGRFAARFGFHPTAETTRAAREMVVELDHISRERWRMEMDKTLLGPALATGIGWLHEVGALDQVLPIAVGASAADVERICVRLSAVEADPVSRWAVLLISLATLAPGPDPEALLLMLAASTASEYRFSNRDRRSLVHRVKPPPTPEPGTDALSVSSLRRFYAESPDDAFARLAVARALVPDRGFQEFDRLEADLVALLAEEDPVPQLPTGLGTTLATTFGLKGAQIGAAMARLREAIFDGDVPNKATTNDYVAHWRTLEHTDTE